MTSFYSRTIDAALSSVSYSTQTDVVGKGVASLGYNQVGLPVSYEVGEETICKNTYNEQEQLVERIYPKHQQSIKNLYDSRGLRSTQIIKGNNPITFNYVYDEQGREIKRMASDGTMRITKYLEDFKVISYSNKWGKWFNRVEHLDGSLVFTKPEAL